MYIYIYMFCCCCCVLVVCLILFLGDDPFRFSTFYGLGLLYEHPHHSALGMVISPQLPGSASTWNLGVGVSCPPGAVLGGADLSGFWEAPKRVESRLLSPWAAPYAAVDWSSVHLAWQGLMFYPVCLQDCGEPLEICSTVSVLI